MMQSFDDMRRVRTFVGASGNPLRLQVRDESTGQPVDLTGYASVLVSADFGEDPKIARRVCTIEVGTEGWVNFTPAASEIDVAGDYRAQLKMDAGTGDPIFTRKFILVVEDVIDNA